MDAMEWVELQTLAAEITNSRSRLVQARSRKDNRLARTLEEEILAAERRRDRLVAQITTQFADAQQGGPEAAAAGQASAPAEADAAAPPLVETAAPEQAAAAPADPAASQPAATASVPEADTVKGGVVVWDQLTPSDIERAKGELGVRRSEMLARHAEELKGLDAAQVELDTLERAIEAFARRFKMPAAEGGVVQLEDRRETRLQAAGQA